MPLLAPYSRRGIRRGREAPLVGRGCRGKQSFEEDFGRAYLKAPYFSQPSLSLSRARSLACSLSRPRPLPPQTTLRSLCASPSAPSGAAPASAASSSASALPALDAARSAADDEDRAPAAGRLVEFVTKAGGGASPSASASSSSLTSSSSSASSTSLALLLEPDGKRNWFAVDARGTRHSLKPAQIFYVFAGKGGPGGADGGACDEADLKAAAAAADRAAARGSEDSALLRDAWEMCDGAPGELLTAPALADLLYGGSSLPAPAATACVLRLLSSNPEARVLFKQTGRKPPVWVARPERDVLALEGAMKAAEAAAEALGAAAGALRAAAEAAAVGSWSPSSPPPPPPSPVSLSPAEWLEGPHRPFIEALDAFALEKATQAQASLATAALRALGPLPAPLSSALLGTIVGGAPSESSKSSASNSSSPSANANALRSPFPPTSDGAAALLSAVGFRPRLEIASLRRAGLTDDFDAELEAEAERLLLLSSSTLPSSSSSSSDVDPDACWRLDLTSSHRAFLAIDDASTTEVDDAVSVERGGENGGGAAAPGDSSSTDSGPPTAIWVHVADPTRWVPSPRHPLALEAARRTRTLYLPTGPVPMFPKALAEGLFSLSSKGESGGGNEGDGGGRTVPALSVRIPVLPDGSPDESAEPSLHVSTLRPVTRMTYDEADEILNGGGGGGSSFSTAAAEDLAVVGAFAAARFAARGARGAATFDLPELQVFVDLDEQDDKRSLNVRVSQLWAGSSLARRAVAEAMIAANEAVAVWGGARAVPLPFRGQPASAEFAAATASASDDDEGPKESGSSEEEEKERKKQRRRSEERQEMEELAAREREEGAAAVGGGSGGRGGDRGMSPAELVAAYARIFSSQRSTLSTDGPASHAGLGLEAYVQSTSPIRRYSDLVAHWQVKAALRQLRLAEAEPPAAAAAAAAGAGEREEGRGAGAGRAAASPLPGPTPSALASELSGAGDQARELSRAERAATAHWVGRFFADEASRARAAGRDAPVYGAVLVSWIRRETGLARALLRGLGVETTLRLNGPARLGDELTLSHEGTDEVSGGALFKDVSAGRGGAGEGANAGVAAAAAAAAVVVVDDDDGDAVEVVVDDDEEEEEEEVEEGVSATSEVEGEERPL